MATRCSRKPLRPGADVAAAEKTATMRALCHLQTTCRAWLPAAARRHPIRAAPRTSTWAAIQAAGDGVFIPLDSKLHSFATKKSSLAGPDTTGSTDER